MSELYAATMEIPMAEVGPCNPFPPLAAGPDAHARIRPAEDAAPEDARWVGWGIPATPLPYLMQDGYGRRRVPRSVETLVLENGNLAATFLPSAGGRLWSLFDKIGGRELLFRNPVFQPANLAIRNAWFAGGVEWNVGLVGHCPFTCSDLFASRVEGPDGPVLRMYEWERIRGVLFQVDAFLPDGSPALFVNVRIVNPGVRETPMYWWSNTAVEQTPRSRVLAPAADAYTFSYGGAMRRVPVPLLEGQDVSYPARGLRAADYFFRIPDGRRRWIAAVDGEGRGLFQASSDLLRGRKLFLWGCGEGGKRWQEHLCGPGHGYFEIQAGLARTQAEHLPMPGRASWSWLEAYGPLSLDPVEAHAPDWERACAAAERAIGEAVPAARLEEVRCAHLPTLDAAPGGMLHSGSGWGALEARRRTWSVPGLPFDAGALGPEQRCWLSLLEGGRMAAVDGETDVRGIQSGKGWRDLLEDSVLSGGGEDWLPWYHLGVLRAGDGERAAALEAFRGSLSRRRTVWALRNAAILLKESGEADGAIALLLEAVDMRPDLLPLAVECGAMLLDAGRPAEWLELTSRLPEAVRKAGRVRLLEARARLDLGSWRDLDLFFRDPPEIPDMREGEVSLTDLWFSMHERKAGLDPRDPASEGARRRVRGGNPPTASIDFRMG